MLHTENGGKRSTYAFLAFLLAFALSSCLPISSGGSGGGGSTSGGQATTSGGGGESSYTSETPTTSGGESSTSTTYPSTSTSDTSSSSSTEPRPPLPSPTSLQQGTILHAWNWGLGEIKKALPDIAAAGYLSVQTSPMQPQKDYYPTGVWRNEWWKLYQPFGLVVATHDNALGTREDLRDLCQAAENYGVNVIVDVVLNHLAGVTGEQLSPGVRDYEPKIYDEKLYHVGVGIAEDTSPGTIVRGTIGGFPDLMTENSFVQSRALSLLKDYLDLGVHGFRFDAAKHIETPDDGQFASNFWPYVLGGAKDYAAAKDYPEPYFYGEVLNTCGSGRSYSSYSKMMSVTDSEASNQMLDAAHWDNYGNIVHANVYRDGLSAKTSVLWAESHDTFVTNHTGQYDAHIIDKGYAVAAARKDVTTLFLARPDDDFKVGGMSKIVDWKSPEVSAVNAFHNAFIDSTERFANMENCYLDFRKDGAHQGAVIVGPTKNVSFNVGGYLDDGPYKEMVTGHEVSVSGGRLSVNLPACGIVVLDNQEIDQGKPYISVSDDGSRAHSGPIDVTIRVRNADSASYQIDQNPPVTFNNEVTVHLGEGMTEGQVNLKVTAAKGGDSVTRTFVYTFMRGDPLHPRCINIPEIYRKNRVLRAWVWGNGVDGSFVEGTMEGDDFTFTLNPRDDHFLLASFKPGEAADWGLHPDQTIDISVDPTTFIYDCGPSMWK